MWKCVRAKMPSGHTGRSKDGSKKTSSLIRSEPTTSIPNLPQSKERSRKNVGEYSVNCNVNETATSLWVLKEADSLPKKVAI